MVEELLPRTVTWIPMNRRTASDVVNQAIWLRLARLKIECATSAGFVGTWQGCALLMQIQDGDLDVDVSGVDADVGVSSTSMRKKKRKTRRTQNLGMASYYLW